jgi:serine/threonine-protein kinase
MQYKKSVKNTQLIAEELGVDYIVEGTVQRERPSDPNGRVKIRPRLIRTADDAHVWADIYEDDMSKVFHLQAKVAEHVAQALDITLVQPERQALAYMPTESIEAYNYYVRGNEYSLRPYQDKGNLVIAIQMYEKAVELDPLFALAHAKLSQAYSGMYHFNHDRSETRRDMAREEAKRALELNPGLPEAHWALGVYHYWCRSEYVQALEELEIARKSQPKNSRLLSTIGYVQRRQGQFEPALTNLKKALEIDPASFRLTCALGNTYRKMGEYPEAASCYEKAIQLAPDEYLPYVLQANLYLAWKESTAAARDVLEKASQYINLEAEDSIVYLLFRLDLLEGNYQQALARLPLESPTMDALSFPDALRYAEIYGYRNDKELAEEYYEKAMRTVKSKLHEDPNNAWFHSALGVAYAGLGRRDDAVREGRLAVQLQFDSEDVGERLLFRQKDLAYVYTMVGEYDEAVETLELLPSIPGTLPISWLHLKLDPAWIPLRGDARFKRLLDSDK